mmetsp:Transcript_8481/g.20432  ORF Transcript_8481/g.20432 Transcript_8481/m.20432 type:complete len:154 (+) Transcript_8481:67-528(+)|eukprot:g2814.t1
MRRAPSPAGVCRPQRGFAYFPALLLVLLATTSSSANGLRLSKFFKVKKNSQAIGAYPPETCSCACCVVVQEGGGTLACDVPKPSHWKHQACTFALCGNGAVLAEKGPEFAKKQKKAFCETHCGVAQKAARGDTCACKNGEEDPWKCPFGGEEN